MISLCIPILIFIISNIISIILYLSFSFLFLLILITLSTWNQENLYILYKIFLIILYTFSTLYQTKSPHSFLTWFLFIPYFGLSRTYVRTYFKRINFLHIYSELFSNNLPFLLLLSSDLHPRNSHNIDRILRSILTYRLIHSSKTKNKSSWRSSPNNIGSLIHITLAISSLVGSFISSKRNTIWHN